jgi:hypothetical protein
MKDKDWRDKLIDALTLVLLVQGVIALGMLIAFTVWRVLVAS